MKYVKYSFCGIFVFILFFFFIMTANNNQKISKIEKRKLQTFPSLHAETIADGSYMQDLTTAFSDQLELRDLLVKGYYIFQFQRYSGDVVKGKNNELYAAYQRSGKMSDIKKDLKASALLINEVASEIDAKFIFLSIPRKDAVETKNLPSSYISSLERYEKSVDIMRDALDEDITFVDANDVFRADNYKHRYYYITDHHMTPAGAELLYKEILKVICNKSIPIYDLSQYEIGQTIVNGSFNNQIGQSVKASPEDLYILPKYELPYTRYEDGKKSSMKVYDKANTYEDAYMKGDHAETIIDTNRPNLPNILYVGSSFTNILEAFSIPSFNKMVSIDYRHNKTKQSISDYVKAYDIDYVIFIPSQSDNEF